MDVAVQITGKKVVKVLGAAGGFNKIADKQEER